MPTKEEIIEAYTKGIRATKSRFMQIKRADLAVLCGIELKAADDNDPNAELKQKLANLEAAKLQKQIDALEAENAADDAAKPQPTTKPKPEPAPEPVTPPAPMITRPQAPHRQAKKKPQK